MEAVFFIVVFNLVLLSLCVWAIELLPLPIASKRLIEALLVILAVVFMYHRFVDAHVF